MAGHIQNSAVATDHDKQIDLARELSNRGFRTLATDRRGLFLQQGRHREAGKLRRQRFDQFPHSRFTRVRDQSDCFRMRITKSWLQSVTVSVDGTRPTT